MMYNDHGCDYCDSEWASVVAVDLALDLVNYRAKMNVYDAYDTVKYGTGTDGKKTSQVVKDMVEDARTHSRGMKRVHVCVSCAEAGVHHADRTVPVAGVTCWNPAVVEEMVAKATAYAEWDVAESTAYVRCGRAYVRDGSHGPCPY